MKLRHKLAMITGATGGLGSKIAEEFRKEGADLLLVARGPKKLNDARQTLLKVHAPGSIFINVAHVTDTYWMRRVLKEYKAIHILVSCAGVYGPIGKLEDADIVDWWQCVNTNLIGTVLPCQQLLPMFDAKL